MDAATLSMLPPKLLAQYLRDPMSLQSQRFIEEGTDTSPIQSPWQGVARLAKAGLGGYMAKKLRDQYAGQADATKAERAQAMAFAAGKPAETAKYEDGTTINWNEQKPNLMGAANMLSSPDNMDLQTALFNAKINQDQTAANQAFTQAQQERSFAQARALAEMTAQRQIELEKFKNENDPLRKILAGQFQQPAQPTISGVQSVPQMSPQIDQQSAMFNAALNAKGIKAPEGYMFNQNMQLVPMPVNQAKLTDEQAKALGFSQRMQESSGIIGKPEITNSGMEIANKVVGSIPLVGNMAVPPEYQQFDQASRDFINAALRRESGAVISPSEFENARLQYFPQPGDSPEVIAQKEANRNMAIETIMRAGGAAGRGMLNQPKENPALKEAKDAIAKGADPAKVEERLNKMGLSLRGQ